MDQLARRLAAAGYEAPVANEDFSSSVTVTDRDGRQVQVHESTAP